MVGVREELDNLVRLRHDIADGPSIALSVVVPCYNEDAGIDELYRRVSAACEPYGETYEIVLVNDGSSDATREKIFALAERDHHIVGIDLARNYGHQIALSAGLEFCRGQRIFILDADLQDPPELLGPMMAKMNEGYDVVYGLREEREGESWFKLASASLFYRILGKLSNVGIPANTGDFRLISRRTLDHLNAMPERYRFIRGMVSWIGLRQCAFPYRRHSRFAGETHYPLRKMILFAIDAVTSFSVAPLRLASHLGLAFGLLGMATLAYTIFAWALGDVLPGWTSLASITLILGSIQLLMLGIFGEYLGRMYMEAKRRPLFIVNEVVSRAAIEGTQKEPAHG
ncbi:glycosyltransferase family 2 protein [Ensifer sesbaniae]|uniref:glycosyltransferase family 2 protein n=1 Tax=Ensifer sesbaniae TaxID=1214071 RepID=UPI00156A5154|nr:glycosyltransferase family 2 protein [Ensifer sesbaniae]NRQ16625.1 putative glycosyltransferase [Ensifer sesbaniae]